MHIRFKFDLTNHVAEVGLIFGRVAGHKSGIIQPGALEFSAPQDEAVMLVLQPRAAEKGVPFRFAEENTIQP